VVILNPVSVNPPEAGDRMSAREKPGNWLRLFLKSSGAEVRFICVFSAMLLAFNLLYFLFADRLLENFILPVLVAKPCASVMNFINPNNGIYVTGNRLRTFGVSFEIIRGCDGIQGFFLIVCALCAYRMPIREKIPGLFLGLVLAYALNIARIVVLFYLYRGHSAYFDFAHQFVGQTITILFLGIFFIFWISRSTEKQ
jgi:exosortase family protein XrtM